MKNLIATVLIWICLTISAAWIVLAQVDPGTTTGLTTQKPRTPATSYRITEINYTYFPEVMRVTLQYFDGNGAMLQQNTVEYAGADYPPNAIVAKNTVVSLLKRDKYID